MRSLMVAWTICLVGLAGCAEQDGGDPAPVQDALTKGFLRGVVVDQAIRPLPSAVVTVIFNGSPEAVLTTDANGDFGVGDLDAGDYVINVSKVGFLSRNVPAVVVAGELTPTPVQIVLTAVPADTGFVWPIVWEGQVTCGTTFQNWCAAANFASGIEIADDESFRFLFDEFMAYQRTPDFLQAEFIWEPNNDLSQWAYSAFWASTWEQWEAELSTPNIFGLVNGAGYMLVQADRGPLEELDVGFSRGVGVGFSAGDGSPDENPERFTVMVNQPFEAFFHVFYGCVPPEGWLFTVHGDPVCDPDITRPPIPYEILQRSDGS